MRPHVRHYSTTRFIAAASERQLQTYFTPIRAVVRYRGGGQGGQWGIRKSKQSGRYAHTRGTREVRGATWSPNPRATHEPRLRARIHAQRPKGPHVAQCLLRPNRAHVEAGWRTHPPRSGPSLVVARQPLEAPATDHGTISITGRQAQGSKKGRSPIRDTSHYGRVGGRSQPTSFVCVKKVWSPHRTVLLLVNSIYTPTLVSRLCVEASQGARQFEVAHATRATLRRSLLAASARTG